MGGVSGERSNGSDLLEPYAALLPTLVPGMHTCVCVPRMHSYTLMISLCLLLYI